MPLSRTNYDDEEDEADEHAEEMPSRLAGVTPDNWDNAGLKKLGQEVGMEAAKKSFRRHASRQFSTVGTPGYASPEVLQAKGHGPSTDWWSIGVTQYELLAGIPPFLGDNVEEILDSMLSNQIDFTMMPEETSQEARDLVVQARPPATHRHSPPLTRPPRRSPTSLTRPLPYLVVQLLTIDPKNRIGYNGLEEIKAHKWFNEIDWRYLREAPGPFVPQASPASATRTPPPARRRPAPATAALVDSAPPLPAQPRRGHRLLQKRAPGRDGASTRLGPARLITPALTPLFSLRRRASPRCSAPSKPRRRTRATASTARG
jgi:serine/threonine protein kinase